MWFKTNDGYSYTPNEFEPYEDGACPKCNAPTFRQEDGTLYCVICNTIYTSQRNPFIDQKEMHKNCRCVDELFYYFGEIEKLWSENNLSCECIKDLFQEGGIDLLDLSDKSEEIRDFLKEVTELVKGFKK